MKAVDFHNPPAWVRLYIERWLKAPAIDSKGNVMQREVGTPQGGVISPLLANLFLHYAFDTWISKHHPGNPFARYADDLVVHCKSYEEATELLEEIKVRLAECRLTVHPEKTKIVFCKDDNRLGDYKETQFDFLGFTFRPRLARNRKGQFFTSFSPAISKKAESSIRDKIRSLKIQSCTECNIERMAEIVNPCLRGWLNYYGVFRKSAMGRICDMIQNNLVKWAKNKFRKLRNSWLKARGFIKALYRSRPILFAHWESGYCQYD